MRNSRSENTTVIFTPRRLTFIALLLPTLTAVIIRIFAFKELLGSPLRYYSSVGGLDMQGLLNLGRWLYEGRGIFSIYSGLAALVMLFNNGRECPEALILIQYACGSVLAFMIAWTALRLTGRRSVALTAGMAAALYAPEVMFESVTLRESIMVFVCTLSLTLVVTWRRRHFAGWRLVASGAALALPCLVRVSAAFWTVMAIFWVWTYIMRRQSGFPKNAWLKSLYKGCLIFSGAVIIMLPAWGWNYFSQGYPLPFYLNIGYAMKIGKLDNAPAMNVEMKKDAIAFAMKRELNSCPLPTMNAPEPSDFKVVNSFLRYGKKFIDVFLPFENMNNLNYYYIRKKFSILGLLPGPEIIISLATMMFAWWLLRGDWKRKPAILFIYLISMTIPLCVFLPLARYRLALLPVFCIAGAMLLFVEFKSLLRKKVLWQSGIAGIVLVAYCILTWPDPTLVPLRSGDFVAWGLAMKSRGDDPEKIAREFHNSYLINPKSLSAAVNFSEALIRIHQFGEAAKVSLSALHFHPDNQRLKLSASTGLLGIGQAVAAEKILLSVKEPADPFWYYCNMGEALRMQKRNQDAIEACKNALKYARTEPQKRFLQAKIKGLSQK